MGSVIWMVAAALWAGECIQVSGPHVRRRDLGISKDADAIVFPAPVAGVKRWLRGHELERYGMEAGAGEVCIERATQQLTASVIQQAIDRALDGAGKVETVVEFSRFAVPTGKLEFPRSGLTVTGRTGALGPVLWRGWVEDGEGRHTPVWAKVVVEMRQQCLVAVRSIAAGAVIQADDVAWKRMDTVRLKPCTLDASATVGKATRRRVVAGEAMEASMMTEPRAVQAGMTVSTEVWSGAVCLRLTTVAETNGKHGDWVWLKEPLSGKKMRGRVIGPERVKVEVADEVAGNRAVAGASGAGRGEVEAQRSAPANAH